MGKPCIIAISGVKNSGKTTCIERVLPYLRAAGRKIAVIKHDGHEFEPDVPGTDTWRIRQAGAYGTAIFSGGRFMIVKEQKTDAEMLIRQFPEADLILLEGFKYSAYPKIELVRAGNSDTSVCPPETLLAIATDLPRLQDAPAGVPILPLNDPQAIAACLLNELNKIKDGNEHASD